VEAKMTTTNNQGQMLGGEDPGTINISEEVEDKFNQLQPEEPPFPPSWTHRQFIHVKAANEVEYRKYSLFLAGSIEMGRAIQWQQCMADHLKDLPITICNPRRKGWLDPKKVPAKVYEASMQQQVQWELSALENVSVICFFFDHATTSPVTMLELGLWAASGKVVVSCHDSFHKAPNVHITCERYNIPCCRSFKELIGLVKDKLAKAGMRLDPKTHDLIDDQGNFIENKAPPVKSYKEQVTGRESIMKKILEDEKRGIQAPQQHPGAQQRHPQQAPPQHAGQALPPNAMQSHHPQGQAVPGQPIQASPMQTPPMQAQPMYAPPAQAHSMYALPTQAQPMYAPPTQVLPNQATQHQPQAMGQNQSHPHHAGQGANTAAHGNEGRREPSSPPPPKKRGTFDRFLNR
jgi:hypothetical protein